MVNKKKLQVQELLNGVGKTGPELTHGLRELGGDKMAAGLVELWKAGQHNGMVKGATITTLAFSAVIGGYILIKNALEDREVKKALTEIQASVDNHSADDEILASDTAPQNDTPVQSTSDKG